MRWEAILLAGGKLDKNFPEFGDFPSKAYLSISGKRIADYVLDAIQASPDLKRVISVIPRNAPAFLGTVGVTGGETILESMDAGFSALMPETEMALLVTCDLPCLTRRGVEDFMKECEQAEAGFCYSYVSRSDSESRFPGIPHTYVRTREGEFCGGGLIGISPKDFPALRVLAHRVTRDRKSLVKIARVLGIPFIFKFLCKRASIPDVERRISKLLGFPAKGIRSRFPEVAFNIDDSKALSLAVAFLERNVQTQESRSS